MARGVENPIDPELHGVPCLEGSDAGDEPDASSADCAAEVGASGVEGDVLAPGAALAASLLDEEELR